LENEYQKTSRRARALEDVLLPEIDQTLAQIDTALEDMDKEEVVRVHNSLRP
ncbi:MAG: ATPase, partial [Gammaproteobacteria bacterium]|nr:ATPase [Gammaproteobacteria bacterium]